MKLNNRQVSLITDYAQKSPSFLQQAWILVVAPPLTHTFYRSALGFCNNIHNRQVKSVSYTKKFDDALIV